MNQRLRCERAHVKGQKMSTRILVLVILLLVGVNEASAQTTALTYQGKLVEGGNPASGNYDFQFTLFDTVTVGTGTQQGSTVTLSNVPVTEGVFTVALDFGVCAGCFSGANRFLEISVKQTSTGSFTTLGPRQPVTSTPYAIKSLNAANATVADGLSVTCVNCVTSGQIGSVAGSAVTGQIPVGAVPGGSGRYVQNTTGLQTFSNFNIDGNGTAGGTLSASVVNATNQYNIGGVRVFSVAGTGNVFAGVNSGTVNTGGGNSFFGADAGVMNTTGGHNSFFGNEAGRSNTTGGNNSFFGQGAGEDNTTGGGNSFFGPNAGGNNTTGANNSFFGLGSGTNNTIGGSNSFFGFATGNLSTTGDHNSFFGAHAGDENTTGTSNSFFGASAGHSNRTADHNSYFGDHAGVGNTTGTDNASFGYRAGALNTGNANSYFGSQAGSLSFASGSNNAFYGYFAGYRTTTGSRNVFFGSDAGFNNTEGEDNVLIGSGSGGASQTAIRNTFIGSNTGFSSVNGSSNTLLGYGANVCGSVDHATAIGADSVVCSSNTVVLGRTGDNVNVPGNLFVEVLGTGGSTNICTSPAGKISTCSSSLRYKTSVQPFNGGLDIVRRLHPIAFDWKEGGMHDVGFGAEEVEKIEPLLTTRNSKGEIEGVKYGQLTTVLVNAVKKQQAQIEEQRQQIAVQQDLLQQHHHQLEALKKLLCSSHRQAEVCKKVSLPQTANFTGR